MLQYRSYTTTRLLYRILELVYNRVEHKWRLVCLSGVNVPMTGSDLFCHHTKIPLRSEQNGLNSKKKTKEKEGMEEIMANAGELKSLCCS